MVALIRRPVLRRLHHVTFECGRAFASTSAWQSVPRSRPRPSSDSQPIRTDDRRQRSQDSSSTQQNNVRDAGTRANRKQGTSDHRGQEGKSLRMASRVMIPDISAFYSRDGTLTTTQENAEFFRETGIESDHGKLWNLTHPEASKFRQLGIEVSFSNRYAINPYHLRSFAPRGDPWAAYRRSQYKTLLQTKPLWVHSVVPYSSNHAAVRQTCTRRLAYCARRAAELLAGEDPPIQVRGTILIFVRDAIKAVNLPAQEFQDMMVMALRKEMHDLKARGRKW